MPIQISCLSCGRQLRVPDNLIGQMVKCPGCEKTFLASVEGPPPSPGQDAFREEDTSPVRPRRDEGALPTPQKPARRDDEDFDDVPSKRRRDLAPHRGTMILLLGVFSWVTGCFFLGIAAWFMGSADLKEMRAGRMDREGESATNIGRIFGLISTILSLIGYLCGCVWFALMMVAAGAK